MELDEIFVGHSYWVKGGALPLGPEAKARPLVVKLVLPNGEIHGYPTSSSSDDRQSIPLGRSDEGKNVWLVPEIRVVALQDIARHQSDFSVPFAAFIAQEQSRERLRQEQEERLKQAQRERLRQEQRERPNQAQRERPNQAHLGRIRAQFGADLVVRWGLQRLRSAAERFGYDLVKQWGPERLEVAAERFGDELVRKHGPERLEVASKRFGADMVKRYEPDRLERYGLERLEEASEKFGADMVKRHEPDRLEEAAQLYGIELVQIHGPVGAAIVAAHAKAKKKAEAEAAQQRAKEQAAAWAQKEAEAAQQRAKEQVAQSSGCSVMLCLLAGLAVLLATLLF